MNALLIGDFILDNYSSGTVDVLTHCLNCMPTETQFTISANAEELVLNSNSIIITELEGNGDG